MEPNPLVEIILEELRELWGLLTHLLDFAASVIGFNGGMLLLAAMVGLGVLGGVLWKLGFAGAKALVFITFIIIALGFILMMIIF